MQDAFTAMFREYAEHHQRLSNKIAHAVGVPLIILSLQIFLSLIFPSGFLAWILFFLLTVGYLYLEWRLALFTAIFLLLITLMALWLTHTLSFLPSLLTGGSCFVVGWLLLFIGHYYEGRAPALFSNVFQIFIAPLFLVAELRSFLCLSDQTK